MHREWRSGKKHFGATLRFPLGSQVAVESTDRGLAFTVGSDR